MTSTTQDQQEELQNNSSASTSNNLELTTNNNNNNNNNNPPVTITAASSSASSTITLIAQHSTQPEISNLVYNAIVANDIYGLGRILRENPEYDINTLITNTIVVGGKNRNDKSVYLTPLMISCTLNYVDITKYLLKKEKIGIDLQDKNGRTALFHATHNGNDEIVNLLLQYKVNVNIADKNEMSPLLVAATYGHVSISKMLLEGGFQIDIDYQDETGKTALALACYQGHTSTVELLIKSGANVNAVDKSGWTPLMSSAFFGRTNICYKLLESNANKSIKAFKNHKNASDLAIDGGFSHLASMINNYTLINRNTLFHKSPNTVTSISSINSILASYNNNNIEKGVGGNVDLSNFHYDRDSKRVSFYANPKRHSKRQSHQVINSISSLAHQNDQDDMVVIRPHPSNHNQRDSLDYKSIAESMKHNSRTISAGEQLRDEMKPRKEATLWSLITLILTFYIPDYLLVKFGKLTNETSRQAWKEKLATCFIIVVATVVVALLTINLSFEFCGAPLPLPKNAIQNSWSATGTDSHRVMIVRGKIYDVGDYFNMDLHRPVSTQASAGLTPFIQSFYGQDATKFFPLDSASIGCDYTPTINQGNFCGFSDGELNDGKFHCHSSKASFESLKTLFTNIHVSVPWDEIKNAANNMTNNKYIIYDSFVYNLTDYLSDNNNNLWLGNDDNSKASYKSLLNSIVNKDSSFTINRRKDLADILPCLEHFNIGKLEGVSTKCVVYSLGTLFYVGLFISIGFIKIVSSLVYNFIITKRLIKTDESKPAKNLIVMIPCYSEPEESISAALRSLAVTDYPDKNKLFFIIVDGKNIVGKSNSKPTSQIVKDLLDLKETKKFQSKKGAEEGEMEEIEPQPLSYTSIAKEKGSVSTHNMAQIYSGHYRCEGRSVPVILVVKCGTPEEIEANKHLQSNKSGNRGKRDSQMILFNLLRVSFYNAPMTKLDFELFEKIRSVSDGLTVDDYELMTMIDADTIVDENSLKYLKNFIDNDDDVIGICGEAQISNKTASLVTMIQVFEYYMSYNMGKPFECLFLNSLCLPGCFAMYRIYAKNKHNSELRVPVLIDDYVFTNYFNDENDTLHQKNLILGEDRYLTTLIIRAFPRRKIVYCTDATCQTTVPETFSVLLSQRRRWINGTIHNQLTLLSSPGLPGRFCFSVQFVMFTELFIAATLPFSLIYFFVYFLQILLSANPSSLTIITSIGVYMMNGVVALFRLSTIKWYFIYMASVPFWNIILPLYSFWYIDDFSWGGTQKLSKVKSNDNIGADGEKEKSKPKNIEIKTQPWMDWRTDYARKNYIL